MLRITPQIVICVLASGCSVLAPVPDRSRFFTLSAMPEAQVQRTNEQREGSGATRGIVYGLGPIKLPAYLDRREVALRVSPAELTYSQTDRWAEPLTANVTAVLLQNLIQLLDTTRVVAYPWIGQVVVDYQVEILFLRFESDAAGNGLLTARWAITDTRGGRLVAIKETTLSRSGSPGNTTAATTALSGNLGELSREIAAALQALPAPQQAPVRSRKRP
jgi:hypothetical protein